MKLSPQELQSLFDNLRYLCGKHEFRTGQALFNALYTIKPELANQINGNNDPFYIDKNIKNFFKFICSEDSYKQLHKSFK